MTGVAVIVSLDVREGRAYVGGHSRLAYNTHASTFDWKKAEVHPTFPNDIFVNLRK